MLKPAFIDLSHHNVIPESLVQARLNGILGVVHKATEGTDFVDEKLPARRYLARGARMLWGVYHFIQPGSVEAQVTHFLKTVQLYSDRDTLYALDWEVSSVPLEAAVEFMERLERATHHQPVLYSGYVLKEALAGKPCPELSCYPLWIAQYGPEAELPPGWDQFWAWQYTDQGTVAGITPPTDLNAYYGEATDLPLEWPGILPRRR